MFTVPVEDVPVDATPEQLELANRVAGKLSLYLNDWATVAVLLARALLPVAIGYRRVVRVDLC